MPRKNKDQEKILSFTIQGKELDKLRKWKDHIKGVYGEYGSFTYRFCPTGIGDSVYVYSEKANIEIELTDYDSW